MCIMVSRTDQFFNANRPRPLPVILDNIPDRLKELRQWVLWRYQYRDGPWAKVPLNPKVYTDRSEPYKNADTTDPKTWGSFYQVANIYRNHSHEIDGIGIVLQAENGIIGVDG